MSRRSAWVLIFCAGCGRVPRYACPDPSRPCDEPAAVDAAPLCAGACTAPIAEGWSGPLLLWSGPPDALPPCPAEAPHREYDGHRQPVAAATECPGCSCAPSTGTCGAPPALTAHAATCRPDWSGVLEIPLGSPGEGACAPLPALPASCNGGPCAASVTVAAPVVSGEACAPSSEPPPLLDPPGWITAARACRDPAPGACATPGAVCAPSPPEGFSVCVRAEGWATCPDGWPERQVFFEALADTRACAPCTCGPPAGGACTVLVSLYEDAACTNLLDAITVASSGPICVDLAEPGTAPGGADVGVPAYQAGECTSAGGGSIGAVDPVGATTFCCR